MTPARWERIEKLFAAAVDLPATERGAHLTQACGDDDTLRSEVESLIASATGASESLHRVLADEVEQFVTEAPVNLLGTRIGPYELVELLGEGGMGAVYLGARADDEYRRNVAIKIMRYGLGTQSQIARFRDERQILAVLDHPNIVKLLDGGRTESGLPYLVMEHIVGVPIVRAARDRALSVRARVELVVSVCGAVQYAHTQLVVHRDLKPSNILVAADGVPKLLDFGIAKLLEAGADREALTHTGTALFTPEYASPEQVRGEQVSTATDIYSLGAVLYELLADRPPLPAVATPAEMIRVISEVDPAPPSSHVTAARQREIAGDLDNIVQKALHKERTQRYASGSELAADLQRYLDGRPVLARTPTIGYRVRKFVRRNRTKLTVALTVAAGLSVAASVATVILVRGANDDQLCSGHDRAASVWSSERKAAVRTALLANPTAAATDAWHSVERKLDRYAKEWATMHQAACTATRKMGEQSETLLDLRMRCLDHKLEELAALSTLLATPGPTLVSSSSRAAQALRLDACADVAALGAPTPLPDPFVRVQVEQLRTRLAGIHALGHTGRYKEQLVALDALVPQAAKLGYAPLLGESLYAQATSLDKNAEFKRAADVMREAGYAADEGGDHKLAARARTELVWMVGHGQSLPQQGLEYAREAEARIKGLGGNAELEGMLAGNLAQVLDDIGRYAEGNALGLRALERREAAFGPDDVQTAIARVNVAVGYARTEPENALPLYERALETYRRELGEHHPLYAHTLFNIADAERTLERPADARRHAQTALELITSALGPEHNLVASAENVLGLIDVSEQRWADAEIHLRRALALAEKLRGPEHLYVGHYATSLAQTRREQGHPKESMEYAHRALAIYDKLGDKADGATARAEIGNSLAALGDAKGARAALEASLAVLEADPEVDAVALSNTRFALAQLLIGAPSTAARARELATKAIDKVDPTRRARIVAWQAAHP